MHIRILKINLHRWPSNREHISTCTCGATLEEYEESLYETTGSREIPTTPGAVAFPDIYHKSVVVIDPRCPARYVNDARGTKLQNNIVFELVPDVRKTCLDHNKGAHLILQARALKDIEKNEQLLADMAMTGGG